VAGVLLLFTLAELFPNSKITAFSNSRTQRGHIEGEALQGGLSNLKVITGDVVTHDFEPETFNPVISIELFEHMKNYQLLLAKVAKVLKLQGRLFIHIFAHKE
jgi:cyclopropane fatty-acyl-phospholipid synthase-like methyltransferase